MGCTICKAVWPTLNGDKTFKCRKLVKPGSHSPYCARCRSRRFREKFPLRYVWHNVKHRAKERGHAFKLSFEDFSAWAIESSWFDKRGKRAEALSIDRIDPEKGYEVGNLRAVTLSDNSKFANEYRKQKQQTKEETYVPPQGHAF